MGGEARPISSPTASPHRPQIQRPPYRARTPAMYGAVHSSVNPQQSHATSVSSAASIASFNPHTAISTSSYSLPGGGRFCYSGDGDDKIIFERISKTIANLDRIFYTFPDHETVGMPVVKRPAGRLPSHERRHACITSQDRGGEQRADKI
uniref:Uncharacterized protein n=1 Tax=Oryza brachyantha TaxID=4533 RepID=J3MMX1_ORYBR